MLGPGSMTGMPARSLLAVPREACRNEELIAALDQQSVGEGARRWVVHVLGLHTDGCTRWIQVAPSEQTSNSIVLQLPPDATSDDALTALGTMELEGRQYPQIVQVSRRNVGPVPPPLS